MRQITASFPRYGIIREIYGTGKIHSGTFRHFRKEMSVWQMYRNQLRGQHSAAGVPQPAYPHAQGFQGAGTTRKCSLGWFYGFKLHLICNDKGEILNFMITPGDVDDREPLKITSFVEFIYGKLVGDKGYIGKDLFSKLFIDGIQLITKLKNNMKGGIRPMYDRILLRKRAVIETINDELKNIAQIEHSRHRSFTNFVVNLIGGIAAYCLFPKKPMINLERVYDNQLTLF